MKFIENYIKKQKKKSFWAWVGDIVFAILLIGMLIPSTRTPIMVFVKEITMFAPSVSVEDNYGQLTAQDYLWKLKDTNGQTFNLNDFKDKPLFINFWATWCPPCIAEMPAIERLYQEYGDEVHFLLVSHEEQAITKNFLKEKSLNIKTYQMISKEPEVFLSSSIPITFIVNKDGALIVKKTGSNKWDSDSVKELLDELISEKPN